MAKNMDLLLCFVIIVMDVTAGILGIQAEIAQNKVNHLKVFIFDCHDPSYQAFKLGLVAVVLLILAHALTIMLGGCVVVRSKQELDRSSSNKQLAMASHVFLWLMFVIAFGLLVAGTHENSKTRADCGILAHHRRLSFGGILCFIHGLFAVSYYVTAAAVTREERELRQHGGGGGGGEKNKPNQPVPV